MPRLSVWLIRASLLYLGVGMTIGALLLWHKGVPFLPLLWQWRDAHLELMLSGWMLQFALGVAFWIVPRFSTEPRYGNVRLVQAVFVLFNAGVLLAAFSAVVYAGRALQVLAAGLFLLAIWQRIKPFAEGQP
jgi:hypothetical protein